MNQYSEGHCQEVGFRKYLIESFYQDIFGNNYLWELVEISVQTATNTEQNKEVSQR